MNQKKFVGNATTRAYKPTRGNCSGILSSVKNQEARPWRGLLERDAMMLWDLDPEVESFHVEPIKIPYFMPSGRKSYYTPDRLVHYRTRPSLLLEIKPACHLRKKRAIWKAKFAAADAEAHRRGWVFKVWTEKDIRTPLLDNSKFFRRFATIEGDESVQNKILEMLRKTEPTTGDTLLNTVTSRPKRRMQLLPQVWRLIALRKIQADWSQRITIHSELRHPLQPHV